MKKHIAIHALGGNGARAARALRVDRSTVARWPTDDEGNITSRHVVDSVLAALARMNFAARVAEDHPDAHDGTLRDLFAEPPSMNE